MARKREAVKQRLLCCLCFSLSAYVPLPSAANLLPMPLPFSLLPLLLLSFLFFSSPRRCQSSLNATELVASCNLVNCYCHEPLPLSPFFFRPSFSSSHSLPFSVTNCDTFSLSLREFSPVHPSFLLQPLPYPFNPQFCPFPSLLYFLSLLATI